MRSFTKYLLLIPLRFNDGTLVPPEFMGEFEQRLFALAGGYTIAGLRKGAYKMADGSQAIDETVEYWVAIPDDRFPDLERFVAELGSNLGQESMYLEKTGSEVYFVPPSSLPGESK
jgi:hypothetical protein